MNINTSQLSGAIRDKAFKTPNLRDLFETPINTMTEDELLSRAKDAVKAGDKSQRDAAEALAMAKELHGTSQAAMARAIGKSEAWVSALLQWKRSGYRDESAFGPTTKAGRLQHAEDRAASDASKPRRSRKAAVSADANATSSADGEPSISTDAITSTPPDARSSTSADTVPSPSADAPTSTATDAPTSTNRKSPAWAKGELIYAINLYWPSLDDAGKADVTDYFHKMAGVRAS